MNLVERWFETKKKMLRMKDKYPVIEDIEDYPGSVLVIVTIKLGMGTRPVYGYWNYQDSNWYVDLDGELDYKQIQEDRVVDWHYVSYDDAR